MLFIYFFTFLGRQGVCPYSYVSLSAMKKSHLHNSLKKKTCVSRLFYFILLLLLKDFDFVANFVNSSKSETHHDIHKIYLHFIETPPSKSKTQHGVRRT